MDPMDTKNYSYFSLMIGIAFGLVWVLIGRWLVSKSWPILGWITIVLSVLGILFNAGFMASKFDKEGAGTTPAPPPGG